MGDFWARIKREWELFALVLCVFFGLLILILVLILRPDGIGFGGRGQVSVETPSALGKSAFAFLDNKGKEAGESAPNPFLTGIASPKPVAKPVKPAPVVKEQPKEPEPAPVEEKPVEPEKLAEPPKPAGPVRIVGIASYAYMNVNASGKSVAVFALRTSPQREDMYALGVGESGGGVKVLGMTEKELWLLDASGRRWKVEPGRPRKLWVLQP